MLPRHLKFPLTMIAILVQRASHSSMLHGDRHMCMHVSMRMKPQGLNLQTPPF